MGKIDKFCEEWADKLIWVFIFTYIYIFSYICFLKYNSFGYYDWDFASDVLILWNSVHGKMFYYPFLEQIIFGAHLYLIIIFFIPIYAIFQHPFTLLFLQSMFLGLAAYPLYLLAKLKLNKTFALATAIVYLLYPSVGYINLFESHFEIYEIFFLFYALYYFEKGNFNKFLIFTFLAIICKENVSLVVFMLGVYALIRKRSKKWVLVPSALGIAWFFLAIKIIIPYFAKDAVKLYQEGFIFSVYYQHLGKNILDMIKTIIIHPIAITKYAFTQRKILYLLHLFLPTGFMGFLSPTVLLITVPIFMQNLLSAAPTHAAINLQYVALLIPFIFASTIYGCSKLLNYRSLQNRSIVLVGFLIIVIASGIFLGAPQLYFARYIKAYQINDFTKEKDKMLKLIPKDSSVIATFQFLPKLAHRYDLYSMHLVSTGFKMYTKIKYVPPSNLEYALIDFDEPLMVNSFFPPQAPDNIRSFLEDGNWRVLKAVDDVVLFAKNFQNGNKLCEIVSNPRIQNVIEANINNQIIFLGYDIESESNKTDRILHLVYYWKRTGDVDKAIGFFIQFLDSDNKVKLQKVRVLGYRVYIPTSWPEGRIIKEHSYIFIPSDLKKGIYNVRAGLFCLDDGRILSVLEGGKTDSLGRIILGDFLVS